MIEVFSPIYTHSLNEIHISTLKKEVDTAGLSGEGFIVHIHTGLSRQKRRLFDNVSLDHCFKKISKTSSGLD